MWPRSGPSIRVRPFLPEPRCPRRLASGTSPVAHCPRPRPRNTSARARAPPMQVLQDRVRDMVARRNLAGAEKAATLLHHHQCETHRPIWPMLSLRKPEARQAVDPKVPAVQMSAAMIAPRHSIPLRFARSGSALEKRCMRRVEMPTSPHLHRSWSPHSPAPAWLPTSSRHRV